MAEKVSDNIILVYISLVIIAMGAIIVYLILRS